MCVLFIVNIVIVLGEKQRTKLFKVQTPIIEIMPLKKMVMQQVWHFRFFFTWSALESQIYAHFRVIFWCLS